MACDFTRAMQMVLERISRGETVPVKKEFQESVANALKEAGVCYEIKNDTTRPDRILFRRVRLSVK